MAHGIEPEPDLAELQRTTHRRLNVGCGPYYLNYFVNIDADPDVRADIHGDALEYLVDCLDGQFDHIYAGHFLEHLARPDAQRFLEECYRVLAPGGRLGVVVPDMRVVLRRWVNSEPDQIYIEPVGYLRLADLDDVCRGFLFSDLQASPHRWAWDCGTLARAMRDAGFVNLQEIDRYQDMRLGAPAWYQVGLDGYKPETLG